ncbi:hypothetical protein niasHT_003031 [Heterodera trifolii]|uniref:Uncharacterized protein n=1 Tax=Heterodera trifolii TaxID=157864 RepID=A0ABD2M4P4_9BILA
MHEDNDGLGSQSVSDQQRKTRQTADRMNDELPQPTITPYSIHIHPKLNFYPPHSFITHSAEFSQHHQQLWCGVRVSRTRRLKKEVGGGRGGGGMEFRCRDG